MASIEATNPFRSPEMADTPAATHPTTAQNPWKEIAREWEKLRLIYVVLVGLTWLPFAAMVGLFASEFGAVFLAVAYVLLANVLYLMGPVLHMYAHWLTEPLAKKNSESLLVRAIYSGYFRGLLFMLSLLIAIGLTIALGMGFVSQIDMAPV